MAPVNENFNSFYDKLSNLVDTHVPSKRMTPKEIKLRSKLWINLKIIKLIKYRDRLKRKMKHKFTIENEYLYKKFRNRVASELKASYKLYYHKFFEEHKCNMKMLWSGIRSIINLRQNDSPSFSQLIVNGKKVNDPKSIASTLNQYFVNVPKQVNKDIPRTRKCLLDYLSNPVENSLSLKPTDPKEIEAIILSLNNSKSSGPFSIPIRLLKTLAKGVSDCQ